MASNTTRDEWLKYNKAIRNKRTKKTGNCKEKPQRKFQGNFLTVQRLSPDVSGKAQKYTRIGARVFVPIESSDVSLDNIKSACEKHFAPILSGSALNCDVLAGERGPSCKSVDQIPDLKIIHVRFINKSAYEDIIDSDDQDDDQVQDASCANSPCSENEEQPKRKSPRLEESPTKYPLSMSVVDMIKLGKLNNSSKSCVIQIYRYDLGSNTWSHIPDAVEFYFDPQKDQCGEGRFRKVYKAKSFHREFRGKTWVIKKYLAKAREDIDNMGLTLKEHSKKTVQMHYLAKNFALQLEASITNRQEFGQPLNYRKLFFGEINEDECVTIEEFIDGKFTKYINNNGESCSSGENELKAQCLTHFTYVKSEEHLMLLDVQGSGVDLYDPEIASNNLYDEKKELMYCIGNLSMMAIQTFLGQHECNKYCRLVGLEPIPE